jgi:ammonium transporter, Amt family
MDTDLGLMWIAISAVLVFIMQAGFLILEAGLTRPKNNINVALKNLTDFAITSIMFWGFGYALMFGTSAGGLFGTSGFLLEVESVGFRQFIFFFFQVMFCGTAVTIIAGAIAERCRFNAYLLAVVIVSGLVYPVFGHWAWNGIEAIPGGWLDSNGFVDFAGSSVVHSVGGWASLALVLILGPRLGRFRQDGGVNQMPSANIPTATLGVFLLWFGWFGFNGGSTLTFGENTGRVLVNTMMGGAAGMTTAILLSWFRKRQADSTWIMNGTLAGLVAITANAHATSTAAALLIGAIGCVVMLLVDQLLIRLRIDDAVGAIPVHLGAGIWGTLAAGLFGQPDLLGTGLPWLQQVLIQVVGIVTCGIWVFGSTYLIFRLINLIYPLRVSAEAEEIGLNVSEHGAVTESLQLLQVMQQQQHSGDTSLRAPVQPFSEIGQIAAQYNNVMQTLERTAARSNAVIRSSLDGIITFEAGTMRITSFNPAAGQMFGYMPDQVIGQPLSVLLGAPDGVPLDNYQLDAIFARKGHGQHYEIYGRREDGSIFPMSVVITQATVGDESFYTGVFHDISQS